MPEDCTERLHFGAFWGYSCGAATPAAIEPSFARRVTNMKTHIVRLLIAVTLSLGTQPAWGAALRVMTYNIHHAEGTDNVIDLDRIADVINAASPDIVALQEVYQAMDLVGNDFFQLDGLAALTGMQAYFGPALTIPPAFGTGEYGNGVLVRSDITITGTANHPLPNPAAGEPRALIEMGLSWNDAGSTVEFTLLATHFDNASETNRLAQAAFANSLVAGSSTPALLAGDLNANLGSAPMQLVYDEWTNTSGPISQIDYVLYRGTDQWNVVEPGQFIVNSTTQVASDHFPLLAVVEFVPEPPSFALAVLGALIVVAVRMRTYDLRPT